MRVREIEGKCVREKGIHVEREREKERTETPTPQFGGSSS